VDGVVTDVEGKNDAVDDEDVTRPATSSAALGRAAAGEVEAPADREVGDGLAVVVPAGRAALRRLAPEEGAGESLALAAGGNVLGRSHSCDIPLLSATASRQHAEIIARDGEWFLCPAGGKTIIVDGRPVFEDVRLRHEMRIRLGSDELIFLQEDQGLGETWQEDETYVARSDGVDPTPAGTAEPGRSPAVWIALCGAAVTLAALAFWLLL
jgi:hypothetical protein